MSSPSAVCLVNNTSLPTSGTTGINVSASSTITIALASSAGVNTWNINCTMSDGVNPNSSYSLIEATKNVNYTNYSATFTAPAMNGSVGASLQFTSIVNAGQWNEDSVTFGVFVLCSNGLRMFFNGENLESNATYGVSADLNALIGGSGSVTFAGDLSGNSTTQTVVGIQGNPIGEGSANAVNQMYYWNGSSFSLDTMDYAYYVPYQLIAGIFTTTATTATSMAQITIDPRTIKAPTNYSLAAPFLFVDFATSAGTATAQLYNATDSVNVGTAITTTSSTVSEYNHQMPLGTSSGDIISNAAKSYQLLVHTTSGTVTITNARIVFSGFFSVIPD